MKSSVKPSYLRQGATILGIVGMLLVLTYLLDFGIRLFAAQFENLNWQQGFLNEMMDRGITPLLGLSFIFVGSLLQFGSSPENNTDSLVKDGRFWMFIVASLFGLLYLILIPLHFNTTGKILTETVTQFDREAARAEQGIQSQQAQLKQIVDSGEINKLIANEQLPPAQKQLLTEVKADPTVVEKRAKEELEKIANQKATAVKQANSEALLARLRSELRSLVLAIAYIVLGWTGLRNVLK
jgi:hypothetical protein